MHSLMYIGETSISLVSRRQSCLAFTTPDWRCARVALRLRALVEKLEGTTLVRVAVAGNISIAAVLDPLTECCHINSSYRSFSTTTNYKKPPGSSGLGNDDLRPRMMATVSLSALPAWVAEGEGFEPSRRCYRLRDFQSRALGQAMRPFQIGYRPSAIGRGSLLVLTD
jgi:hypothetical protein